MSKKVSEGLVHKVPSDFKKVIVSSEAVHQTWEDISVLARNEWICWIISAKKDETRIGRINRAYENLKAGKRRPCCWAGCSHR